MNGALKIAHVTTVDISLRGLLLNQMGSLRAAGYEVCGISSPGSSVPLLEAAGVRHIAVPISRNLTPFADLVSLVRLIAVMRRERFAIVHTHTPKAGLLGQLAARIAGVPVVVNTIHGFYFHEHMSPLARRFYITMEKVAALCSTSILSQNAEDMQTAIRERICAPEQIVHLGNGIDVEQFDPALVTAAAIEAKRAELGLPRDAKVIGFVGRLAAKRKGFLDFLQAAATVAQSDPRVRVLVVGDSDHGKPDAVDPAVAKEYGIWERCHFLGDRPNAELPLLYRLMDVLVLPSLFEGLPRVIMEASAMGVPSVASNVKGNREAVVNGRNGRLVPLSDVPALSGAIRAVLDDPRPAESIARECRAVALEHFDERRVFERVKAEYAGLLAPLLAPATATGLPVWKYFGDLVLAGVGLVLLAPVLALLAVLVACKLGRPVIFRQTRPGLRGEAFTICKFRTMTDERDASGEPLPDEVRLTPFGRWLRSTSLDELPELWNVLCGEMSLVGPRPLMAQYLAHYSPRQARRHDLLPGITGWSQINGRNAQSWDRKFALDAWYVEHVSPKLDLWILWKTVSRVLARDGIAAPDHATSPYFYGTAPEAEREADAEVAQLAPAFTRREPDAASTGKCFPEITTPRFLAGMLAVNFCFLLGAVFLGWWLRSDPTSLLGDTTPVADFSSLQLLVMAWFSAAIFPLRRGEPGLPVWRQARLVWLWIAAGYCFLTADQLWDIHEWMDETIHALLGIRETAWTDRLDDFIVIGYGLVGLGVLYRYRGELVGFLKILPFLAMGFGMFALSALCDVASNRQDFIPALFADPTVGRWTFRVVSALDQVCTLIAECFFATGFYAAWRQAWRERSGLLFAGACPEVDRTPALAPGLAASVAPAPLTSLPRSG